MERFQFLDKANELANTQLGLAGVPTIVSVLENIDFDGNPIISGTTYTFSDSNTGFLCSYTIMNPESGTIFAVETSIISPITHQSNVLDIKQFDISV